MVVLRGIDQSIHVLGRQIGAMVDARRAQLNGQPYARTGPELIPVHPELQPAARPASRIARASSPSNACGEPGSQKTSIQREYGAAAVSIGPATRSTYPARSAAYSCRNDVAAQEGGLLGELAGDPQRAHLVARRVSP